MLPRLLAVAVMCMLAVACEQAPQDTGPLTAETLPGNWVIDPASEPNAAFNIALSMSERDGEFADDASLSMRAQEIIPHLRRQYPSYGFVADGTWIASTESMLVEGTWTIEGDVVKMKSSNETYNRDLKIVGQTLVSHPKHARGRIVRLIRG